MNEMMWHEPLRAAGCREVARGKVRHRYMVPADLCGRTDTQLMVASDRVSAYDFVFNGEVQHKGAVLNVLPIWWQSQLGFPADHAMVGYGYPYLKHLFGDKIDEAVLRDLATRCCAIRFMDVQPVEAVVRGNLTGGGWEDYVKSGRLTVFGQPVPNNLRDGDELPCPLWTPTTKARDGHDLPITHAELCLLIGQPAADQMRDVSLRLYAYMRGVAKAAGLIMADTKYEWSGDQLVDEWGTTDSSRYWDASEWKDALANGRTPASLDKQRFRDWVKSVVHPWGVGINHLNPEVGEHWEFVNDLVVAKTPGGSKALRVTSDIYLDLIQRLTGHALEELQQELLQIPSV